MRGRYAKLKKLLGCVRRGVASRLKEELRQCVNGS